MEAAVAALIYIGAYSRAGAKIATRISIAIYSRVGAEIFPRIFITIIDISSAIGVKISFRSSLQTN